tara:strand:+ start:224 stop:451 length:228 start_codon:yes stop_codon:yes gene_type:complete
VATSEEKKNNKFFGLLCGLKCVGGGHTLTNLKIKKSKKCSAFPERWFSTCFGGLPLSQKPTFLLPSGQLDLNSQA